ncbi:hypothetical protein RND81_03G047500 [Saponaria officinalis]|uniref:BRF2-like C-terminal domain-containing protein n=1 Tax=Saponaria officinalis TaxID=3572 RepID=A0AAW1M4L1_SAPOF
MAACKRCKKKALVIDDVTGNTVCSSCGIVQAFTNFQHQFGDGANYVAHGTTGSGHDYSYRERKMYEAKTVIEDIVFRLGFADALTREVKEMVKKVTEGDYGLGNWFSVLVGAACYIVMRMKNRVLTINEVCDVVGCELYEMGRMVGRVVDFLELELPEFDVVGLLERTIKGFSGFSEVDEEKVEVMVKQGNFVVQCCIKWWLTTGRRPGPVAVAVLVFVAGVNGITVRIEEVAKEVNVGIGTCKLRYKELLEALVEVAKGLPWGNDINVKNIVRNAPSVMKYMEMKSLESKVSVTKSGHKKRRVGNGYGDFDVNDVLGDDFGGGVGDETNVDVSGIENGSQPDLEAQGEVGGECGIGDLKDYKDSIEAVANLYSKLKADFASHKNVNKDETHDLGDGLDDPNFQFFDEWWSGKSELCEKIFLNQLVEKDVGLNALPPSYIRGCQSVKRRREKIRAAKTRINSIRFPSISDSLCCGIETTNNPCLSVEATSHKKRKSSKKKREKQNDSIDWEDFIIETLLLHNVKEEEIEKGYYKALLGLYVFKG